MGIFGGQQYYQQVKHEPMDVDVPQLLHRRNCKRSWQYELRHVEPKKFRRETANGQILCEMKNTKAHDMDQAQDSSLIYLSTTDHNYQSYFSSVDRTSSISNPSCKHALLSNNSESNKSNMYEYERMLFETHGCTIYHHQRTQSLDNDYLEAEF